MPKVVPETRTRLDRLQGSSGAPDHASPALSQLNSNSNDRSDTLQPSRLETTTKVQKSFTKLAPAEANKITRRLCEFNEHYDKHVGDARAQWHDACKTAARQIMGAVMPATYTSSVVEELAMAIARKEWYRVLMSHSQTAQDNSSPLRLSLHGDAVAAGIGQLGDMPIAVKTMVPMVEKAIAQPTEIYRLRLQEIMSSYNEQVAKLVSASSTNTTAMNATPSGRSDQSTQVISGAIMPIPAHMLTVIDD